VQELDSCEVQADAVDSLRAMGFKVASVEDTALEDTGGRYYSLPDSALEQLSRFTIKVGLSDA